MSEVFDNTISGYRIKNRTGLANWASLFEERILAHERYCRVMGGNDAAYIYNERAHVGVLAGAAWRCGKISLEESQYEKGYKNKPKWLGRADLYIADENTEELIEAKFRWISLQSNKIISQAEAVLQQAIKDSRQTRGADKEMQHVGVAFLSVYLPPSKDDAPHQKNKHAALLDEKIEEAIKGINSMDCHAVAWCFPKELRRVADPSIRPGVFLVASNIKYT